jgi:hypothetical protein
MGRDRENQRLGKNQGMVRFSDRNRFPFEPTFLGYRDCLCEVSTNDLGMDCISIFAEKSRKKQKRKNRKGRERGKKRNRKKKSSGCNGVGIPATAW